MKKYIAPEFEKIYYITEDCLNGSDPTVIPKDVEDIGDDLDQLF